MLTGSKRRLASVLVAAGLAAITATPLPAGAAVIPAGVIVVAADGSGDATTLEGALRLVGPGGHIMLAPGSYAGGVEIRKDVTISGAGDGASVVLGGGGEAALAAIEADVSIQDIAVRSGEDGTSRYAITVVGGDVSVAGCEIEGVTIGGFLIEGGARADVSDCSITDVPTAIRIAGEGTTATVRASSMADGRSGVVLRDGAAGVVEGNVIEDFSSGGILVIGPGTMASITENTITDSDMGIRALGGATADIDGNTLTGHETTGISVDDAGSSATVRGNDISSNGWGVEVSAGADAVIEANTVSDQVNTGIWVGGPGGDVRVRNNEVRGNQWGIYAAEGASPYVAGNTLSGQIKTALNAEDPGTRPVFRANDISGGEWGIWVSNGAHPTIVDNDITHADTAVEIHGAKGAVRANRISGGLWAIEIEEGATSSISDNVITDPENTGIYIGGEGTMPVVRRNEISGGDWAVAIADGAHPTIEGNAITDAETGIDVENGNGLLRGNVISGGRWGILVSSGASPTVQANRIVGPESVAIAVLDEDTVAALIGNVIELEDEAWGVWVTDDATGTVSENAISGGDSGVVISATDATVRGNTVTAARAGMTLHAGTTATIDGNELAANETGIDVTGSDTTPTVRDNAIVGGERGLSISDGAAPSVEGNRLSDNAVGIDVRGFLTEPSVVANSLERCGVCLLILDGAEARIEGNTVSDSRDAGIRADGLGTIATIAGNTFRGNANDLDIGFWADARLDANDFEPVALPTPRPLDIVAPEIMAGVERLRGLEAKDEVPIRSVSPEEAVSEHLADLEDEDLAELRADEILLKRLGLLPQELDLLAAYEGLIGTEVFGYYRPDVGDIAIIGDGLLDQEGEWGLAHEFVHALQQQHFDLEATRDAMEAGDERAAFDALVEGDATWTMMAMAVGDALSGAPDPAEQAGYEATDATLGTLPLLLRREMLFPYLDGMGFVQRVWGRSGWSEVDDAWRDPPLSTEQIMHPALYPDELPVAVHLPDVAAALGEDWTSGHETTMGEMRISVFVADDDSFEIPLLTLVGVKLPKAEAAAGWGGDRIVTLDGAGDAWAVVWQTTWDTVEDAGEFAEAARAAMGDLAGVHTVSAGVDIAAAGPDDHGVLVLIADGADTMSQLHDALGDG